MVQLPTTRKATREFKMAITIPVWLYAGQQHNFKGFLYISEVLQQGATVWKLSEVHVSDKSKMATILYMASLFDIITQHRVNTHQYTDDLRLYLYMLPVEALIATDRLDACFVDVEAWLKASRLRLNPSKTMVSWLGSAQQLAKLQLREVQVLSHEVILRRYCEEPWHRCR